MIQTIFLKENEKDILGTLQKQGIDISAFENRLADLFNRVYNNFVGYYIFRQKDTIYKLIVLPKTIAIDSGTIQKDFVNYLLHYYRINSKYGFDETRKIPDSLLSLAFEDNNKEDNNSHLPLDEFEFYKYKAILERIEKFFKKHKNYKKVNIDYKSQDIKYKLNLAKNIKELDKTKIHQIHSVDIMYSQIATVAYNALKLFISKKIKNLNEKYQKDLIQNTKKIINFISRKYPIDKSYKLTLSKLNNFKTKKIFDKKNDSRLLLVDIKSLFGFEQVYEDNEVYVSNRYDLTTTSFFIDPILFYEWYVYDILKDFATDKYELLFDKDKDNKTMIEYDLVSKEYKKDNGRSSNPDYILIDKEKDIKIVLDAKWKNIKKLGDIKSSDFLKLKHDTALLENNTYKTIPYLIYSNYLSFEDQINISKEENQYFDFGILQIDMNFEEGKNKIDFKYDYEKIEEQIEKEKFERVVKSSSERFRDQIDTHRSELITKLLNSENLEDKEEVFSELDNILFESAEKLTEKIGENISPEIEVILKIYKDVLAEDSVKFLKSSSSIYNYYKDSKSNHFDYAMPGSGLWKLVELELNTSFVWYIRIKKNICDKNSKELSLLENDESFKIGWVELNEHNKEGAVLKGLMLGQIKFLSGNKNIKKIFNDHFISNELFNLLKTIIDIRNEHAHIKAMSLDKFKELYQLLFGDEKNIYKLLDMKKQIQKLIMQDI